MTEKVVKNKIISSLVELNNISMQTALSEVSRMSQSTGLDIVVTPNIDHLARLINEGPEGELSKAYENSSLCLCDSKIVEKLFRLKGKKIVEVIAGSTLTQNLFKNVLTESDNIMIVGGDDFVISKLSKVYKHLKLFHYNPPMGFINKPDEVSKSIEAVKSFNPDYLFLAVGSPRQEVLADKLKEVNIVNGVALCIGASILFLVGEEKRAPMWIQKLHCEWFYRMIQDPKRLVSRYASNLLKLPKIYLKL